MYPLAAHSKGRLASVAVLATLAVLGGASSAANAQVNVSTYHYDNLRTGWNQNETMLTQSSFTSFGLLATVSVDDQVDAQPLLVSNETIDGGLHNVVYVATENNSVYAIDAQSGQVLLQTNLGAPVPQSALPGYCGNNGPNVGISSTPVIDTSTGALYLIAMTLQNSTPTYYVHALSLTTLSDIVTPVQVAASARLTDGSVYRFNAGVSRQRAALLLSKGTIYAGFASFCDLASDESRGWLLGWQESTLAPLASNKLNNKLATSPDDFFLSSVWMSGYGLAANSSGSVYFVTGNSDHSGNSYNKKTNISESAAEMSSDLSTQQGLFTPGDHAVLDEHDTDFGSGGLMLLPTQPGKYPDLAVAAGKEGILYLLDADNLGTELGSYRIGRCWCGASYYQGSDGLGRVVTSGGMTVEVWAVVGTPEQLIRKASYRGIADGQDPGFFTSVSSNGTAAGSAIVWAVGRPWQSVPPTVNLYAVNPDSGQLLFHEPAGTWPSKDANSNIVPVVANGLVYVASYQTLTIFGPGGTKTFQPPKIRVDMSVPLAPGEHEVYAFVRTVEGAEISAQERGGKQIRIDASAAEQASRFAPPSVGHALTARGKFDKSGVLLADIILHAKDNPAMWPLDR